MRERNYFAAMMVNVGEADALVSGHSRSYPSVVNQCYNWSIRHQERQ